MARTPQFRIPATLAVAAILAACPAFAATPDNYIGGDGGLWSDPTNWSTGDPGGQVAQIDTTSPTTVVLNSSTSISSLILGATDVLKVGSAATLRFVILPIPPTINGTLSLAGIVESDLGGYTLTGSGIISFDGSGNAPDLQTGGNFPVTIGPNLTIRTGISGGQIEVAPDEYESSVINQGIISAETPGTTITLGAITFLNSGVLQAVNGAVVNVLTPNFTNSATLSVTGVSSAFVPNLHLINTGLIQLTDTSMSVRANIDGNNGSFANTGTVALQGAALTINSAWANTGTISAVNSTLTLSSAGMGASTTGVIAALHSTLGLSGTLDPAMISFNSNIVNLGFATMDFGGSALVLNGTDTQFNLVSTTLKNLTLANTDGAEINLPEQHSDTRFYNVVLNNATIHMNTAGLTIQTGNLTGTATIYFDGNALYTGISGGPTSGLVPSIDPGISIRTGSGGGTVRFVNSFGLISAETPGAQIIIQGQTNSGLIQAINGATLQISLSMNASTIDVQQNSSASFVATSSAGVSDVGTVIAEGGAITFSGYHHNSGVLEAENGGVLAFTNGTLTSSTPIALSNASAVFADIVQSIVGIIGTGAVSIPSARALASDGIQADSLSIAGAHTIRQNNATTGTSKLASSLAIANSAGTFTGKLDLTNNALILQTDPATPNDKSNKLAFLSSALIAGNDNGDWLGMGITSATVAADNAATGSHTTTLALYNNALLSLPTIGGLSADSNSLFITTALIADANFDGSVDKTDFDLWHANAMTYAFSDSAGDFNHDGAIDGRDFALWFAHAPNAQAIVNGEGLSSDILAALFLPPLTIPEPASILFLAPLALLLRRRHRLNR